MADVTREELQSAFHNAVSPPGAVGAEAVSAEALSGDAKDFFCKNWTSIKGVLEFIAKQLGGLPALAIKGVIAAGDLLHDRICGGV